MTSSMFVYFSEIRAVTEEMTNDQKHQVDLWFLISALLVVAVYLKFKFKENM